MTHHSRNGFLTAYGYEVTAQRSLEGLEGVDMGETQSYLDKVGSVSALVEGEEYHVWDDLILDEQHRRFLQEVHNGREVT